MIAPPRNATLATHDAESDTGPGTGASNGPSGFLTVLFFMLDVKEIIGENLYILIEI